MNNLVFSRLPYTKEELEQFRDEEGYIDLNLASLVIVPSSRNQLGASDIFKYWVDFNGIKALLKQEKQLDGEQNGTLFSELVMAELCKKMGIECAEVDLFKFGDFKGLISYMAFDREKESLMMTRELVGDIPKIEGIDAYGFESLEQSIKEKLRSTFKLSSTEINKILFDRKLQKILQLYSSEMDNHLENEGFLFHMDKDGKYHVRVCPMFDNELSFGLGSSLSDLMTDGLIDGINDKEVSSQVRAIARQYKKTNKITSEEISVLKRLKSRDDLVTALLGYKQTRDRVVGNGLQLGSAGLGKNRYYSMSDDTLAEIYNSSLNQEDEKTDFTLVSLRDLIADFRSIGDLSQEEEPVDYDDEILTFIENLESVNMQEIVANLSKKYSIPNVVKAQLDRFARMKKNVLKFVLNAEYGEVEYYEMIADELLEEIGKRNEEIPL